MTEIPVTGAVAEYRGHRFRILFGGDDWVALSTNAEADIPDAFDRGESLIAPGHYETWVKVPISALDHVIDIVVTGTLAGHTVSLMRRLPNGQIGIEFVGSPVVARELGLYGDQYMGWTGLIDPDDLNDIRVEETLRA
ncbi:hypothetical protein [Mycolicibacterium houstonense]|uniref:hypothetical protein n=1 Tax=Mycolicibacterium houstonense TaxID=146021 RepID=UPI003F953FC0